MVSIQFVLGLIKLITIINENGFDIHALRMQIEHATTMIIAIALAHVTAKWKNSPNQIRVSKTLLMVVLSLAFLIAGITRIRGIEIWNPFQ